MEVLKNNKRRKSGSKTKFCWEFASYAMQGRRSNMEDCHCVVENFGGVKGDFFAGVFDGHSGDRCSKFLSDNLPADLVAQPNFSKALLNDAMFHDLFLKTDQQWLDHVETKLKSTLKTSSVESPDSWDDGSTAVCLVFKNNLLSVANCGDSRCIVGRKGKADQITLDHRPDVKSEKERLEKSGIKLSNNNKLGNILGVSRSFGDYSFKRPVNKGLVVDPDYFEIKITDDLDFIVLACDGLFEELDNQDIVATITTGLEQGHTLNEVVKSVCMDSYNMDVNDNISCIIIRKTGEEKVDCVDDKAQKKIDKEAHKLKKAEDSRDKGKTKKGDDGKKKL